MSPNKCHGLWLDFLCVGGAGYRNFLEDLFLCQDSLRIKTHTHAQYMSKSFLTHSFTHFLNVASTHAFSVIIFCHNLVRKDVGNIIYARARR